MKISTIIMTLLTLLFGSAAVAPAGDFTIHQAAAIGLAEEAGLTGMENPAAEKEPFPEDVLRKVGWAKRFRIRTVSGELIQSKAVPDIGFNEVASITISKRTYAARTAGYCSALATLCSLMIMMTGVTDSEFVIKAEPEELFLGIVGSALIGGVIGSFFRQWETVYVAGRR